jgi:hypothetical protein
LVSPSTEIPMPMRNPPADVLVAAQDQLVA